jgi:hypothetical protein
MPPLDSPFRFDLNLPPDGRIELQVPLPPGSPLTVFVVERNPAGADDLVAAAESSTEFWNNPEDDEDWNNA